MHRILARAAFAVIALAGSAHAEDGQWTEVTKLPKGLNLPSGVSLSVLGIEPGMHIDEVRPIASALMAEHVADPKPDAPQSPQDLARAIDQGLLDQYGGASNAPPLQEVMSGVALTTPGGDRITLEYTGRIDVERDLAAFGQVSDELRIDFSAPSSGHQVIGVQRFIEYNDDTKQPRIAPMLAELKSRFGEPMTLGGTLRWQFDGGNAVHRADAGDHDCWPYIGDIKNTREIDTINTRSGGDCDIVLDVQISTGISSDHAKAIRFTLSDNERGKANLITDFGFFRTYAERYVESVGGDAPKL